METTFSVLAWSFGGLAALLILGNLTSMVHNLRGGRFQSAIMFVPTICAGLAVVAGAPWWWLAVIAPLDLVLPFLVRSKPRADDGPPPGR